MTRRSLRACRGVLYARHLMSSLVESLSDPFGKPFLFFVLLVAAHVGFGWTVLRFVRFMMVGRPGIPSDRVPERLGSVLVYWLAQRKVPEQTAYGAPAGFTSAHHLIIFWGFLVITVGTTELWLNGLNPMWDFSLLGPLYHPLKWGIDVFNLLVLCAVAFGFFRRLVVKPRLIPMSLEAGVILGSIGLLMVTHYGYHGFRMVAAGVEPESWAPVSSVVAQAFAGIDRSTAHTLSEINWWVHIFLLLGFLNFIPYSKHIHIVGSLPNIFFRNLGQRGVMPKLDLEDETNWGVGRIERFDRKSLMDQYACTECARCSNFCPAFNTDKPLSPMKLIHDLRDEMIERGAIAARMQELEALIKQQQASLPQVGAWSPQSPTGESSGVDKAAVRPLEAALKEAQTAYEALPPLVGGRIHDETLWACTTCGACQEVCPVFIDHPLKILQMRTHLVLAESRMPSELARTFQNLEKNNNPWGIAAEKRMDWAEGLDVPTIETNPDPEYLLFVGCAGAFDDRIKKTMRALVDVLHAAEVSFAVLGHEEGCSGDPARRAGNEYLFQTQAEMNVTAMNAAKVRKVIASCPHCFHTIKNEYPQFGGRFEVIHHTRLIAHLLEQGRLKPDQPIGQKGGTRLTYHDSCYLGRWNGEYDGPRAALSAVADATGGQVVELERNREHGFCCGGGGGRMWMEEKIGTRVNLNRTDEILASGADVAAVACPFCTIMVTDGVKARNAEEKIQVLDIAEVIAKSLRNKKQRKPEPKPEADNHEPPAAT
jgi:Fe-S oxidoreductase